MPSPRVEGLGTRLPGACTSSTNHPVKKTVKLEPSIAGLIEEINTGISVMQKGECFIKPFRSQKCAFLCIF